MGFLDKAKSQMASATALAKDAAQKGQAKLDSLQAKRAADALLRDLGAVVYGQRTGRASATADADASRLIGQLQAHESEHGQIDLGLEADGADGVASAPSSAAPAATAPAAAPASAPMPPPVSSTDAPPPPPPTSQHI